MTDSLRPEVGWSPTVSVMTPTYNRADLLPRAMASVLNQDYSDLELLIIDDGSTDDTANVVRKFQERDPRVRYTKLPENSGVGYARDFALRQAAGRYIGFVDSDDVWLPGKLRTQVEALDRHPDIDILFGDFWNVDHLDGTRVAAFVKTRAGLECLQTRPIADGLHLVEAGMELGMLRKNFIQLGTVLLRGEVITRVGGFNPTLRGAEDFEFCWRAAALGARYAYRDSRRVERHRNASSITADTVPSFTHHLAALEICRATCETARRPELGTHIRGAEQRAWRNIIGRHGREGQRAAAIRALMQSFRSGVSMRTLLFAITAICGPQPLAWLKRARAATADS